MIAPAVSPELEQFLSLLRSRGPTLNLLYEHARASQDRGEEASFRDAFGRAIVDVLYHMLRELWARCACSKRDWKKSEPAFNGCSLGQILAAALGCDPHAERVLLDALSIPSKKSGKHGVFRGAICWQVLNALTGGAGYAPLDVLVRDTALYFEARRKTQSQ